MKFDQIVGYEEVKREFNTLMEWYTAKDLDSSVRLPRGVLLVGSPGLGKTLFMRSLREEAPLPVFCMEDIGDGNMVRALLEAYHEASQEPNGAIVLLDELDRLVEDDSCFERCLKELMDGIESQNRVLFIASANHAFHRSGALARPGRFDRIITLRYPTCKERRAILSHYLSQHGQSIAEADWDYLLELIGGVTNAELVAIATDVCLRAGGQRITREMLERSVALVIRKELYCDAPTEPLPLIPCVHEAGHAVLLEKHRAFFTLHRASVKMDGDDPCGTCYFVSKQESDLTPQAIVARIEVGLAGFLATKLLLGTQDAGSAKDLLQARFEARVAVNSLGYNGVDKILREYDPTSRNESWVSCLRNERLATRLIKRCEREAKRTVKRERANILRIARVLQQNGVIDGQTVREMVDHDRKSDH